LLLSHAARFVAGVIREKSSAGAIDAPNKQCADGSHAGGSLEGH
jgi:hypothetical protein